MIDIFLEKIDELYNIILLPMDNSYKLEASKKYKKLFFLKKEQYFGEFYYNNFGKDKYKGTIYTPKEISDYMVRMVISKEDIINNPYIKILDPASGCGNILIPCYIYLFNIYKDNLAQINRKNNLNLNIHTIGSHIVKNNIFGMDIDDVALKILIIDLFLISGEVSPKNFRNGDFLLNDIKDTYEIIIGNPPYIGHKSIDKDYSVKLKKAYKEVYSDKGDICYCFFKKTKELLKYEGKVVYILARYFIEAQNGMSLRKYISNNFSIREIVDFYGLRPFKNTGVDPVIIYANNSNIENDINIIKPLKIKGQNKKEFYESLFLNKAHNYNRFSIGEHTLKNSTWILRSNEERNILDKIIKKSSLKLKDICNSYQGIITGCDKAFIVSEEIIKNENLEKDILRPWIKSSYIEKNHIKDAKEHIIYADFINDDENKYVNTLNHIKPYEYKLMNRRECRNGIRKWYQLQWGRKPLIFEGEKIIFPYKSNSNKFALDKGSFFSADIYSLILKEDASYDYKTLLFLLNSSIYEFYYHCFAKKLGDDLYEYYPNTLMELMIPLKCDITFFEENKLYEYFEITDEEKKIIEESL
ncbi:Eco57I restriction-modification methylase domain-containing protein [Clostridium peptidivorans]|uniref:Eco57I restriction-modification methylase domain-containing protein n=1 Tax=Clostridium peptidivorans TaxID=100174 RepID=UPI001FA854B7|nr:N-6 DNA methylase [Clostridium peptidivorans]